VLPSDPDDEFSSVVENENAEPGRLQESSDKQRATLKKTERTSLAIFILHSFSKEEPVWLIKYCNVVTAGNEMVRQNVDSHL